MKKTQIDINLPLGKKVFFASDFHLGSPSYEQSRIREKRIINWIKDHQQEMGALFLLGDVFDYWFEYRHVVPKGFIRLFGKLAELTDSGIDVYFFCGNHDTWVRDYFQKELGLRVFSGNAYLHIQGKTFFVGHGDGLGPDDIGYKFIKHLFDAKISRIFFAWLHPWTGYKLASGFSKRSRQADQLKLNRES
ncbi:MAG: UDP-2,3-diacylglucosamine diphosphatase, partial [Bacteroidales bacterium]